MLNPLLVALVMLGLTVVVLVIFGGGHLGHFIYNFIYNIFFKPKQETNTINVSGILGGKRRRK